MKQNWNGLDRLTLTKKKQKKAGLIASFLLLPGT